MAPTTFSCGTTNCEFVTAEAEPDIVIQLVNQHTQVQHALPPQVGGQAASAKPRAEKVPRPQIKLGIGQDDFSYFKNRWTSYKQSCGITDET